MLQRTLSTLGRSTTVCTASPKPKPNKLKRNLFPLGPRTPVASPTKPGSSASPLPKRKKCKGHAEAKTSTLETNPFTLEKDFVYNTPERKSKAPKSRIMSKRTVSQLDTPIVQKTRYVAADDSFQLDTPIVKKPRCEAADNSIEVDTSTIGRHLDV